MSNNTSVKTILILAANPTNTSQLRLDQEVRSIKEGLQRASRREQFRLEQAWAVRARDFYRAILEHQPQIVHFCGHGTGSDGIVLEDDTGQPTLVDKEALSKLFKLFAVKGVECVVLNACYSQVQAEAISQYIKHVIGMNQAIGDIAARTFAVAFYDALGAGETVEFAFNLGCSQLVGLKEDQTPVLKTISIHPADIQFEAGDIPPNPYLGLSAFGEKDAAFFFGRQKFTEELFQMAHQQQLVAIIGASGSGKSSVVFAGLIPRLREEGIWLIESLRPKSEPFDELALALVRQLEPDINKVERAIQVGRLAGSLKKGEVKLHQVASQVLENKPNKRFLLVVDQFEELYTQCQDKEEQQRFIDTLLAAIHQKSITLVFTLRADFYGYVLSYRPFGNALNEFIHKPLTLMSREELKAAVEQPAQKLNIQLQGHLAERILDDVGNEPGNLPLLEFALTQLWDNQKDGELTHQAYDDIGGVKQALVKHAEQVYSRLSQSQQQQAQQVFLALVRLGEGTEDTRRVATQENIGQENWELVTYLAGSEARLVVTGRNDKSGEETVEIVHEALIREWKRLREWLRNNREKLIQHRKIESDAQEWLDNGKIKDYLLQGAKLAQAEDFWQNYGERISLSGLARELIAASQAEREHKANQIQQKAKQQRLQMWLIFVSVATFVTILCFTGLLKVGEWSTLERFFALRPLEPPEKRILIVTIDEQDITQIGKWPIPDAVLAKLLTKLKAKQPAAIGMDIYRDLPVEPGDQELVAVMKSTPNLIGVKKLVGDRVAPSPTLSAQEQIALSDLILDTDGKVRRGLLSAGDSNGEIFLGLASRLALMYLETKGISLTTRDKAGNSLLLGQAVFTPLKGNEFSYQGADVGGYQILLNYRGFTKCFDTVTMRDVLNGSISPERVRNRIVLIGTTAKSINDFFNVGYSSNSQEEGEQMPGVVIHANLISQILSSALDGRPQIKILSDYLEDFLIFCWSGIGVLLIWRSRSGLTSITSIILASTTLIGICYLAFLNGWWLPLISTLLTLLGAATSASIVKKEHM